MVLKAFNLADVNNYQKFIQTAPGVDKNVLFEDNKKTGNGFFFQPITPTPPNDTQEQATEMKNDKEKSIATITVDGTMNQPSVTVPKETESIITNSTYHKICYGNPSDFKQLLQDIWPHIINFIDQNPEHNHSKQWCKWINSGLNEHCDLPTLKDITNIATLDQLYLILHDSPAINKHFEIQWDHKIIYKPVAYEAPDRITEPASNNTALIYTVRSLADQDMEFCIFHKLVHEEITKWMHSSGLDRTTLAKEQKADKWLQWKKWIFGRLKPIQPAQNIRKIMDVKDIHEYLQKVQPYQPFQEHFIIYDSDKPTSIR